MTGNPLSGHTAANETSMVGSGVFTDSLEDGEHITSPSLTNMLEGVHGNGILLEEDTATGASNRHTPEDLPGVCEQVTNSYTARVTGGHAILDGALYKFANGPGSSQDIAFTTTSDHKRADYSALALTSGQEALIVVYVSTNTAEECITWEMGTPVTTASNTYPTTPSAFLSNPMSSGLDVTQSVVLAVIRVVYSATGGDLNISISESNDKRVFVRPTPLYLTPVTTGVVGNKTAVDSHTALDAVNGDTGNFADSRMGALWQSYNSDGDAILYYSANDSSDDRHTHVLGPAGYVSASPSATTTFTFNEGQVFVLNPSTAVQFNPSGTFPPGHKVFVTNEAAHGANSITFDNAGIGIVLQGKESGLFVYTGSAWKNVMLASGAISPNGHGANGLIQLSDGAGGFTSDSNLAWTASPAELTVTGKLTVTGLIDPPGLVLDEKASVAATGHTTVAAKGLLWVKDDAPNRLYFTDDAGTDKKVIHATDSVTELSDVTAAGSGSIITSAERTKLTGIETGATADQTNAEIRAAVEAATDSNVFTDADHTKLDGIATGATAYADSDAIAAVEGESDLALTGEVTVAGDLAVDTNALFVDVSADQVGINTASPAAELHVYGATNPEIRVQETGESGYTTLIGFADNYGALRVVNTTTDESTIQDFEPVSAGTGAQTVRFFRSANSGGTARFQILQPGSSTEALRIQADTKVLTHYGGATFNENGDSADFRVEGDTDTHLLFVDGSADKVGISTSSPVADLDVDSGKSFRSTRLLTVALSSSTTLTEAAHAGRYIFVTGSSTTITLPANQGAGVHFTLLSNDANGFTLTSTDNMNGASDDITVDARSGVTCISDGSDYVVLGA
jgi:hypothetical protein